MRAVLLAPVLAAGAAVAAPPVTVEVRAVGETPPVGTANDDAADDPAIWHNPRDPGASLVVATDKKAGLYVYGLDGRVRSQFAAGRVNNVDLRSLRGRILVAASDRNDVANARLALFALDPRTAQLTELARPAAGPGEAYGLCLYAPKGGPLYAFVVMKAGDIVQLEIAPDGRSAREVRRMKLATQSEGCVADDRTGQLYVGEEAVGVWRFGANPGDPVAPVAIARVDARLVADVEGVAIAAEGRDGGYLIVSSQGDNAYAVWRLKTGAYVGRFRIAAGRFGATEETDGIEATTASFPGYPGGLFIAQDGANAPAAQNFKLVRWADVKRALKLR